MEYYEYEVFKFAKVTEMLEILESRPKLCIDAIGKIGKIIDEVWKMSEENQVEKTKEMLDELIPRLRAGKKNADSDEKENKVS